MQEHYEIAAHVIAQAIHDAILRIEHGLPLWLTFMDCQNNLLASKTMYWHSNQNRNDMMEELTREGEAIVRRGREEEHVINFLTAMADRIVNSLSDPDRIFFDLINRLEIEFLVMRPFTQGLFMIPILAELFKKLDVQFETLLIDPLSLRLRDHFLLREAEKIVGLDETPSDAFVHSDAPLSMRMFLDYAVAHKIERISLFTEKLIFATHLGSLLMKEIDTFFALFNGLCLTGDFIALCHLYYEKVQSSAIDYLREAAAIMQGRELYGVSWSANGEFVIRKVECNCSFSLSPSFAFGIGRWKGQEIALEPESQSDGSTGDH
jgi:hypothetical protein